MKSGISNLYTQDELDRRLVEQEHRILDSIVPFGGFHIEITRADGSVEKYFRKNVVLKEGLNRIANRAVLGTSSVYFIIGIGTATATHTLASDQPNWGEVSRKTSNVTGGSAQSREWIFFTQTWGGFADSVTSVPIDTAFVSDFPNSHATTGTYLGAAPGLGVTLGNSDFLALTYRARIGSHDIDHTT